MAHKPSTHTTLPLTSVDVIKLVEDAEMDGLDITYSNLGDAGVDKQRKQLKTARHRFVLGTLAERVVQNDEILEIFTNRAGYVTALKDTLDDIKGFSLAHEAQAEETVNKIIAVINGAVERCPYPDGKRPTFSQVYDAMREPRTNRTGDDTLSDTPLSRNLTLAEQFHAVAKITDRVLSGVKLHKDEGMKKEIRFSEGTRGPWIATIEMQLMALDGVEADNDETRAIYRNRAEIMVDQGETALAATLAGKGR